ncbi:MAG: chemotaxis protein CheX [Planctomycetota bacterium]|jgi:chemotaxis protein CheX|nr:chemotaxis protein CheX [Planctomycetota bacterium]
MRIITLAETLTTPNMIRGIFTARKIQGLDFVHARNKQEMLAAMDEQSVVLIDWEGDPGQLSDLVYAAKEKLSRVPVLLLCPKSNAGSVFSGIKAGAAGVINKPFDSDDVIRSVAGTIKKGQKSRPTVNVEFINPFIDATRNVFSSMCQVEVARKKIFVKDDYKMLGDISGVMQLSGPAAGSVVISMSSELARLVVGKMLGEKPAEELTQEVSDATGEIINMISGQAKASLVKTKYHFTISIPKVVTGPGHEIEHQPGAPNIVVVFEGEGRDFSLQVCLAATDQEARPKA